MYVESFMAIDKITLTIDQATWNMIVQGLGETFAWSKVNPVLVDLINQVERQVNSPEKYTSRDVLSDEETPATPISEGGAE
jgi:hypothetical protein